MALQDTKSLVESARGGWIARGLLGPTSDDLSHLATAHNWRFVEVNIAGAGDKKALMRMLADQLELTEDFGANWDALADALWDVAGRNAGAILRLKGLGEIPELLAQPLSEILDDRTGDGPVPLIVVADPPLPTFVTSSSDAHE